MRKKEKFHWWECCCHGSDLLANVENHDSTSEWSLWEWASLPSRRDSNSLSCQSEKFSRSHFQSEMVRTKRKCYGVPASISRFNSPRLLPLGKFKEHGVRHKTPNTRGPLISDWTCHQWYSIRNNPDGMSLCSTSLLGVYCGRRWTFWTCTGSLRNRTQHNLYFCRISLLRNNVSKSVYINLRHSVAL